LLWLSLTLLSGKANSFHPHVFRYYHLEKFALSHAFAAFDSTAWKSVRGGSIPVNFVLYCVVNVQFRRTCSSLLTFCCRCAVRQSRRRLDDTAAAAGACSSAVAAVRPADVDGDAASRCYHFASTTANVPVSPGVRESSRL